MFRQAVTDAKADSSYPAFDCCLHCEVDTVGKMTREVNSILQEDKAIEDPDQVTTAEKQQLLIKYVVQGGYRVMEVETVNA